MSFEMAKEKDPKVYTVQLQAETWKYPVEPGAYDGVIEDVAKFDGKYGETLRFTYSLTKGKETYIVPDYMSFYKVLKPGTKLHSRLLGILGPEEMETTDFDLLSLIGRAVVVTLDLQIINGNKVMRVTDVRGA